MTRSERTGLPVDHTKRDQTLSAGVERRRQPDRLSAYRDCKGFHRNLLTDNSLTESELRALWGDR
jgi:hypothetical protein